MKTMGYVFGKWFLGGEKLNIRFKYFFTDHEKIGTQNFS